MERGWRRERLRKKTWFGDLKEGEKKRGEAVRRGETESVMMVERCVCLSLSALLESG